MGTGKTNGITKEKKIMTDVLKLTGWAIALYIGYRLALELWCILYGLVY